MMPYLKKIIVFLALCSSCLVVAQDQRTPELYPALASGGWGYIDASGQFAIQPQFEGARVFSDGMAPVEFHGKWGYINVAGVIMIGGEWTDAEPFSSGVAAVKIVDVWRYIDKSGHLIGDFTSSEPLTFMDGFAVINASRIHANYYNTSGKKVWPMSSYDMATDYSEGLAWVETIERNPIKRIPASAWTVIDKHQVTKSAPIAAVGVPSYFREGLAAIRRSYGEKMGYVDSSGKQIIPPAFDFGKPFSEGYAAVEIGDKWGFINTAGSLVVKPIFSYVQPFSFGLAVAVVGDHYGFIDHAGDWVIKPLIPATDGEHHRHDIPDFRGNLAAVVLVHSAPQLDVLLEYIDHTGKVVYGPVSLRASH